MEGDLEDLILIRVLPPGSFPQDGTRNLGERPTAGDRWRPLGTARLRWRVDQTWTKPRYGGVHAVCVAALRGYPVKSDGDGGDKPASLTR
jgi:hypothetical protein